MRTVALAGLIAAVFTSLAVPFAAAAAVEVEVEVYLKRLASDEALEREFADRSTPGSPLYLKHLTIPQLAEVVRPRPGALRAVEDFLRSAPGASGVKPFVTGDIVGAKVAVDSPVASLLGVSSDDSRESLSVPRRLVPHVDRILLYPLPPQKAPVHVPRRRKSRGAAPQEVPSTTGLSSASLTGMIQSPKTISRRYNIPETPLATTENVTQSVGEFGSGFSQESMDEFMDYFNISRTQVQKAGSNVPLNDTALTWEAGQGQSDVEYLAALAPGAFTWWLEGTKYPGDSRPVWTKWVDLVLAQHPLPDVVSVGWYTEERYWLDNQQSSSSVPSWSAPIPPTPPALAAAEDAFRKLALVGVTVITSSGDQEGPAAWGNSEASCSLRLGPLYPASSRYVTTVGATYAQSEDRHEEAWWLTGGGFSNFIAQPSWQSAAVQKYLNANYSGMPHPGAYNSSGRAYPDVAALGCDNEVWGNWSGFKTSPAGITKTWFGAWSLASSGSASAAPVIAAIVTRIVAERKAKGKGSLGCITPTLYAMKHVGFDVVKGETNNQCEGSKNTQGWPAGKGWDAATGLGTPDYETLLRHLT